MLKIIKHIIEILNSVKNKYIDNAYIDTYKESVKISKNKRKYILQPTSVLSEYSKYLLWDKKIISAAQEYDKFSDISQEKLLNMSKKIFTKENIIIGYNGNKNLDKEIKKIIALL